MVTVTGWGVLPRYIISQKNGDLLGGFNPFEETFESFPQVGMNIKKTFGTTT